MLTFVKVRAPRKRLNCGNAESVARRSQIAVEVVVRYRDLSFPFVFSTYLLSITSGRAFIESLPFKNNGENAKSAAGGCPILDMTSLIDTTTMVYY
jgi:hypothetical protein